MLNAKQSQTRKPSFLSQVGAMLRDAWALFELQSQLQLKAATSYARGPVRATVRNDRRA
ncbi:hypothetical protein KTD33_20105 [Burkholderia gladioli]|uniref:hypothetical protein n=1 Tax=Burkholderia gladioli TaxID=28095 RepID=UPI001C22086E|nr:hypothetical protein [Burkholderia gladioli]MBU9196837.1 hypothetical protein [Burkholderia gladioli]